MAVDKGFSHFFRRQKLLVAIFIILFDANYSCFVIPPQKPGVKIVSEGMRHVILTIKALATLFLPQNKFGAR